MSEETRDGVPSMGYHHYCCPWCYRSVGRQRDDSKEVKVKEKEKTEDTNNEDNEAVGQEGEGSKEETEGEEANVEILAEYTLADGISWYTRHFIVVKNNSEETVEISTSSLAYGEDGSMVSAADASLMLLAQDALLYFTKHLRRIKR